MFLRKQVKNGATYYSLVFSFREGGRVRQETCGLGLPPSLKSVKLPESEKIKLYEKYPELKEDYERFKRAQANKVVKGTNKVLNSIAILMLALDRTPFSIIEVREQGLVENEVMILQERLQDYLIREALVIKKTERKGNPMTEELLEG